MRLRTPAQQARIAAQQRGDIQTKQGYTSFPWDTHPNDRYVRVFPDGPYDQQWAGIQKNNLISQVGTQRASTYGDEPMYLQEVRQHSGTVQSVNWAAYSAGAGPARIAAQQAAYAQQQAQPPSLLSTFMARLRGQ